MAVLVQLVAKRLSSQLYHLQPVTSHLVLCILIIGILHLCYIILDLYITSLPPILPSSVLPYLFEQIYFEVFNYIHKISEVMQYRLISNLSEHMPSLYVQKSSTSQYVAIHCKQKNISIYVGMLFISKYWQMTTSSSALSSHYKINLVQYTHSHARTNEKGSIHGSLFILLSLIDDYSRYT